MLLCHYCGSASSGYGGVLFAVYEQARYGSPLLVSRTLHFPPGEQNRTEQNEAGCLPDRVNPPAPCRVPQELAPKTPTAFQLENFDIQKRIRVVVTVGDEVREAAFTTTKPDKIHWKIAAYVKR